LLQQINQGPSIGSANSCSVDAALPDVQVHSRPCGEQVWNFMHADDRRMNNHRVGKLLRKKE
jgi:hypothetical protein